jgi:hypothetical protein
VKQIPVLMVSSISGGIFVLADIVRILVVGSLFQSMEEATLTTSNRKRAICGDVRIFFYYNFHSFKLVFVQQTLSNGKHSYFFFTDFLAYHL